MTMSYRISMTTDHTILGIFEGATMEEAYENLLGDGFEMSRTAVRFVALGNDDEGHVYLPGSKEPIYLATSGEMVINTMRDNGIESLPIFRGFDDEERQTSNMLEA